MPLSTINSNSIGNGTVVAADILDGTISSSKLVASNIAGDRLAANTLSNTVFQTGSVENYMRGANLDFGMRNRIINGAMVISQYNGTSSVTPTTNQYTLDRWRSLAGGASSKYSVQQNAGSVTPPAGFTNYFGVTSLSSYSVNASDYQGLVQKIEGYNVADLGWGSANAKTVTLSFWVRSSLTGTFGGAIANAGHDRSYPFTYTISSANTWEQKSITIAGDTTGTWLTDNSTGIQVFFGLGVGSSASGTAGSWAGVQYFSATGATSVVGTNAATWYVTGVQLEEGSVPTSFEYRQYGTELALCQRYACSSFPSGTAWGQNAGTTGAFSYIVLVSGTTAGFGVSMPFPVAMRANPTFTYYNPSAANDKWRNTIANADSASGAAVNIRTWGSQVTNYQVAGDSASQTCQVHWSASAEL